MIEDLNSTNGVFIGEKQVKKHRLRDGDVVSMGVHELVYRDIRDRNEVANDDVSEVYADVDADKDDGISVIGE